MPRQMKPIMGMSCGKSQVVWGSGLRPVPTHLVLAFLTLLSSPKVGYRPPFWERDPKPPTRVYTLPCPT